MDKAPDYEEVQQAPQPAYQWKTGLLRRAPWIALGSIALAIVCAIASAVIVVVSNQKQAAWAIRPSVILALLSSITTGLPVIALTSGVAITWWRTALQPRGTELSTLHYIWIHGHGTLASALAGKQVNRVAIATVLLAAASIAYGPLLQRSTYIQVVPLLSNATMLMDIYRQLPDGIGGTVLSSEEISMAGEFHSAIQDWYNRVEIQTYPDAGYYCNGSCQGYVPSPGIVGPRCDQRLEAIDIASAAENNSFVFAINFTRYDDTDGLPTLEMTTQGLTKVNDNCIGTLVINTCKMQAATVNYPVTINQINVTTNNNLTVELLGDPYASPGDLSTAPYASPAGPLGALKWFGDAYFLSNATVSYNKSSDSYSSLSYGTAAVQYYDTNSADYVQNSRCAFQWTDPTEDIIQAFGEVLFRASFYAGLDLDGETQTFTVIQTADTLMYQSHYLYLILGSAVLLVALISVSITLYGWWELGRHVSLSPLEIAKAFGAQILAPEAFMDTNTLVAQAGRKRVRYGEVGVLDGDGVERRTLRLQELGLGQDPAPPRRSGAEDL